MIVDAILAGLVFYLMFPLLTGYCALQYGRSFGRWFGFGCIMPVVSFFILFLLIYWDEKSTPVYRLSRRERSASTHLVNEVMDDLNLPNKNTRIAEKEAVS